VREHYVDSRGRHNGSFGLKKPSFQNPGMSEFIQVLTTTDARGRAEGIARALVERRLAACVQVVGPVQSTFHWQGKIDTAEEWLCIAKTRGELYGDVEAVIRAEHTYQVPEILAVPVTAGHAPYLEWMRTQVKGVETR
jgi:periplasmic divalent cation tolerance protein